MVNTEKDIGFNSLPDESTKRMESDETLTKIPVALYLRVSDKDKQILDRQRDGFKAYLAMHPEYELVAIYHEKASAKGGRVRKQLNNLMADAAANKFKIAMFWETSRLGRNVKEALVRIEQLHKTGVHVYVANINQKYDFDDPTAKLIIQQMLIFAEFESALNAERTAGGIQAKNAKLSIHAENKGLPRMRVGVPGLLEVWGQDPYKREGKRGLVCVWSDDKENTFRDIWNNPEIRDPYNHIREKVRLAINPICKHKCHKFDEEGNPIKKLDEQYRKQSCLCGKKTSRKTVHKTRVNLGLEPRNEHSFKRADVSADLDSLDMNFMVPSAESHFPCGKRRPVRGGYKKNGVTRVKGVPA